MKTYKIESVSGYNQYFVSYIESNIPLKLLEIDYNVTLINPDLTKTTKTFDNNKKVWNNTSYFLKQQTKGKTNEKF